MDDDLIEHNITEAFPDPDEHNPLDAYSEDELEVDIQIDHIEELISNSDFRETINRITLGAIFSGFISTVPVPDDGIGIPPRLTEYFIGKVVASDEYGNKEPSYEELATAAFRLADAYTFSLYQDFEPENASDEENARHSLKLQLRMREVAAGRFMFWEQPIEVARRAYSPHSEMMREIVGFDIEQAIDFTKYIELIFNLMANKAYIDKGGIDPEDVVSEEDTVESVLQQVESEGRVPKSIERDDFKNDVESIEEAYNQISDQTHLLWIPEKILGREIPESYDYDAFHDFLDRMSVNPLTFNSDFRTFDDHNPVHQTPIIKHDGEYTVSHPRLLRQALMNTFYYDLISASGYGEESGEHGGEFGQKWGDYIENWAYDALQRLFSDSEVYLNPVYEGTEEEAADLIVFHNGYLLVFECKSKKLVLETRSGDISTAKSDLESGIGLATEQAIEFLEKVEKNDEVTLQSEGKELVLNDNVDNKYPVVVLGEQYDAIAVREFNEVLELPRTPYVASIIDLDVILETIQHPIRFIGYISQRRKLIADNRILGQDEIDMLGLFIDNDYEFPEPGQDEFLQLGDYSHDIASKIGYKYGP